MEKDYKLLQEMFRLVDDVRRIIESPEGVALTESLQDTPSRLVLAEERLNGDMTQLFIWDACGVRCLIRFGGLEVPTVDKLKTSELVRALLNPAAGNLQPDEVLPWFRRQIQSFQPVDHPSSCGVGANA